MKKIYRYLLGDILVLLMNSVNAQILQPVHWSYAAKKTSATEAVVFIKAAIDDGWHIYSQKKAGPGGPVSTQISFTPSKDFISVGNTLQPEPKTRFEETFGMDVTFYEHSVIFQQKIQLKKPAAVIKGTISFMVCNDRKCLPPDTVPFTVKIK